MTRKPFQVRFINDAIPQRIIERTVSLPIKVIIIDYNAFRKSLSRLPCKECEVSVNMRRRRLLGKITGKRFGIDKSPRVGIQKIVMTVEAHPLLRDKRPVNTV